MEDVKRTIRLLALILAGMTITTTAARGQNATTAANSPDSISETRSASCLLKIVTDPGVLSLGGQAIDYLFQSSGVRDLAAGDVLGLTPEQTARTALLTTKVLEQAGIAEPVSEQRTLLRLEVILPEGVKPAAKEFMASVIARFQSTVDEACQKEQDRLFKQIELTDREVAEASAELESIQHDLLNNSQDLSSQGLRSSITTMMSQFQALQLEQASKEAYRQAIRERIKKVRDETVASLQADAISPELEKIVERREVELKNVQGMVDSGRATPVELNAQEDKLAQARIDLARRREELAKTGSASSLGQLTNELATLTMEAVQTEARERQLERQLTEMQKLLAQAPEYERMMLRLDVAKKNMQDAMTLHNKARQRARMFNAPSVSVIGG
jgi:hypothetical protein